MEVFLYRCENCNSAKFFNEDHGRTFYVDQCNGCQGWSYYEKVVIRQTFDEWYTQIYKFVLEEKKDGDKKE
jgi:hypothetical protein